MTTYHPYSVKLSKGQLEKLGRAYKNNSAITIRLSKNDLSGPHELILTQRQINKIKKAINNKTGVDVKISKTQIRKVMKEGGSLFSALVSLGTKMLPMATKLASKAGPALASGALSALGSLGIDKIFGKGIDIPNKFIPMLVPYQKEFTKKQINDINKAYQTGGKIHFKPTQKQINGGLLGTLASIGIPMAISLVSKLFGSGLEVPGKGLMVSQKPNLVPYYPPPFVGDWNKVGMGNKKNISKKGQRVNTREKPSFQLNSNFGSNIVKPKFIELINFVLLEWINYLKIPNFKGSFSRDSENHLHDKGSSIINLDDQIGNGTHWVATYIKPNGKLQPFSVLRA